MGAKGRAELGEVLIHHSGLAPPADGADLTSLQVRRSLHYKILVICWAFETRHGFVLVFVVARTVATYALGRRTHSDPIIFRLCLVS